MTPQEPQDGFLTRFGDYVTRKPFRTLANASNLGFAVPLALGASFGAGHNLVLGTAFIGVAGHAFNAFFTGAEASAQYDLGRKTTARRMATMAAGDLLTAVGVGAAVAGAGPVSLAFIGVGTLMATASDR